MSITKDIHNTYSVPKVIMVNDEPATEIVVHKFLISDVDDLDVYIAEPIWRWQDSECGKWVMENAVEKPRWIRTPAHDLFHIECAIIARLKPIDITYFILRWGQ